MSQDPGTPAARRTGRLRRSPRYGVFIGSGVVLGLVVAAVLAAVAPDSQDTGIFGYLLVVFAAFGALLGGLVAVLAAIALARRERRPG